MSMGEKVDEEMTRDLHQNGSAIFNSVVAIVATYGPLMKPADPQYQAIVEAIGNGAEARVFTWQSRAANYLLTIPDDERAMLGWQ